MIAAMKFEARVERDQPGSTEDIRAGEHLIASFVGNTDGPTLVVVGSLHGNEPSGVEALFNVARWLRETDSAIAGRIYLLAGNTRALSKGVRFVDSDLNRHWTERNLSRGGSDRFRTRSEDAELNELEAMIDHILVTARDEVYVLDLHSTSAEGAPFATVGDTLRNRRFAQQFPITILLGIEEQLEGTMLEHLNNLGTVTLGFEGGQHDSAAAVANHEALVMHALVNSGVLAMQDIPKASEYCSRLAKTGGGKGFYEVRYRHAISQADNFNMLPGFENFDVIRPGQQLATDRDGPVFAQEGGVLLMPLYQRLGDDGFFIGRRVAAFWLWLSALLRRMHVHALMPLLPGVSRDPHDPYTLMVNTRIARILPLQIFHLLGFRKRRWSGDTLVVSRRRHDTQSPFR